MKTRNLIIGIAVALVVLLLVGLLVGGTLWGSNYVHRGPGMMWDYDFSSRHMLGGGIGMILFWILLLAAILGGGALLVVGLARQAPRPAEAQVGAMEILRQRYARGEIDREEFERMREVLSEEGR